MLPYFANKPYLKMNVDGLVKRPEAVILRQRSNEESRRYLAEILHSCLIQNDMICTFYETVNVKKCK